MGYAPLMPTGTCEVDGCGERRYRGKLCRRHNTILRRTPGRPVERWGIRPPERWRHPRLDRP